MRPKERRETGQTDLFRARLEQIIHPAHPLVRLARAIDWRFLEERFGAVYEDGPGRPPLPTRLMAGLAIVKHRHDRSDEVLGERWLETPSFQLFGGEEFVQPKRPFDRSSLARQRRGEARLVALLQESLSVATRSGAAKPGRQAGRRPAGDRRHPGPGEGPHLPDRRPADAPGERPSGPARQGARRCPAPVLGPGRQAPADPGPALGPRQAIQAGQQGAPAPAHDARAGDPGRRPPDRHLPRARRGFRRADPCLGATALRGRGDLPPREHPLPSKPGSPQR